VIEITFSDAEISQLQALQQTHPHHVIRERALIVLLKSQKIPHHDIASIADVCENTVRHYLEAYKEGGLDKLKALNFRKPQSRLKSFEAEVKEYFNTTPPATIKQACAEIGKRTGVFLKETQMRMYLRSIDIRRRKVIGIPAKANVEEQKKFHDEKLQPRLEEAKAGKREVHFVDASHFVLAAFLGYLWSLTRVFVRTPSGRQRFNVLGALNAVTKKLVTVTNDTYITSVQVCELLKLLAQNATMPITIVLDNARYQRCHMVMSLADQLGIELLFLPSYSPNLNLIERLWKLVKKECLNSIYYENFTLFRQAIQKFLTNMDGTHHDELESLLTLKFQTFDSEQFKQAA